MLTISPIIGLFPPGPWHPDIGGGCCHSSIWAQTWREVNNMSANITYTNIASLASVRGGLREGELLICHLSRSNVRGQTENTIVTNKANFKQGKLGYKQKQFLPDFLCVVVCPKVCWVLSVLWRNLKLLSSGNVCPGSPGSVTRAPVLTPEPRVDAPDSVRLRLRLRDSEGPSLMMAGARAGGRIFTYWCEICWCLAKGQKRQ